MRGAVLGRVSVAGAGAGAGAARGEYVTRRRQGCLHNGCRGESDLLLGSRINWTRENLFGLLLVLWQFCGETLHPVPVSKEVKKNRTWPEIDR